MDTFEPDEEVDVKETQKKIDELEKELQGVQQQMNNYLKELSLI